MLVSFKGAWFSLPATPSGKEGFGELVLRNGDLGSRTFGPLEDGSIWEKADDFHEL